MRTPLNIHRSVALQVCLALLLMTSKCSKPAPVTQPPPDIGVEAGQALQMVLTQSETTQDFVARFKGKLNTFTPAQVNFARNKYVETATEVNSVVDELKKVTAGTSTLPEDVFKNQATSAVGTNVVFSTLMVQAVNNSTSLNNFVLLNNNKLPDSWTTLFRIAPSLSAQQKEQFAAFLDSSIRFKSWEVIKKK
jgi:hypothetical protein